jgi:hypothetical protein
MPLTGAYAIKRENVVALRLTRAASDVLLEANSTLSDDRLFAVLTGHSSTADGSLVWLPGEQVNNAIGVDGTELNRLEGNYIAIAAVEEENCAIVAEDGFVVKLNEETWCAVKDALQKKESILVPATAKGLDFAVEWLSVGYRNPLDGRIYEAAKGWEIAAPDPAAAAEEKAGQVAWLQSIILLTPESQLAARVNVTSLNAYISQIERTVVDHFTALPEIRGIDLLLQITLDSSGKTDRLAVVGPTFDRAETDNLGMDVLDSAIEALQAPEVIESVRFQMLFLLNGGDEGRALSENWL